MQRKLENIIRKIKIETQHTNLGEVVLRIKFIVINTF